MEEKKDDLRVVIARGYSVATLENIYALQEYMPSQIRYTREEIEQDLHNPTIIHAMLFRGKDIIGYIFAHPHNEAVKEMKEDDPLLEEDSGCYYIDQIVIAPNERSSGTCRKFLAEFFRELNRRGCFRYSSHILAENGLNLFIKRILRKLITEERETTLPSFDSYKYVFMKAEGIFV